MASLENFPIQRAGPLAIVRLPEEVDISNADEVRDTLLAILDQGVTTLVVDMTGTAFCGCAGASAVARAHQRAAANRAQVRVATRVPIVRRVLALTGVDGLVSLFDSVAAATAATTPEPGPAGNEGPVPAAPR